MLLPLGQMPLIDGTKFDPSVLRQYPLPAIFVPLGQTPLMTGTMVWATALVAVMKLKKNGTNKDRGDNRLIPTAR
jgi:hypothetical protein